MRLHIHAHQIDAPQDVSAFIRKHVVSPLKRLHDSPATELVVFVQDTKPRKGGVDQACKMTFRMPNARVLRVESVRDDLHAAVLEAVQRLKRLVQREVQKQRSGSRAPEHKPLGRTWRKVATRRIIAPDGTPSTL